MKVFISHAHSDQAFADRLARVLEEAGHRVWTDREILPGDNWGAALGAALKSAEGFVALVSPEATRSEFVTREWEYALGREKLKNRLVPVEVKRTRSKPWIFERLNALASSDPEAAGRAIVKRFEATPKPRSGSRVST
jgi:hypothetical protein